MDKNVSYEEYYAQQVEVDARQHAEVMADRYLRELRRLVHGLT